jgi:hypothetical protein
MIQNIAFIELRIYETNEENLTVPLSPLNQENFMNLMTVTLYLTKLSAPELE